MSLYEKEMMGMEPIELARHINNGLPDYDLTFAAEILGQCLDGDLVRSTLVPLLEHKSAVVRKGVLYGLSGHWNNDVKKRVKEMAEKDESALIREIAREHLEEMGTE